MADWICILVAAAGGVSVLWRSTRGPLAGVYSDSEMAAVARTRLRHAHRR